MTRLSQRGRRMPVLCPEEGVFQVTATSDLSLSRGQGGVIPETLKVSMPVPSSPWGPPKNEDSACSRERIEAPLPPLQPRPTCERLELLFSCDAILSGYEDLVSSRSDQFTMWGKMSHQEFWLNTWLTFTELLPTSVMILNAFSHPLLSPVVSTNTFSSQLLCRRGSAFTTGTMGPDDLRKMLSRIKLQESGISLRKASEYVEHEILHERFHVTHFAGCAILFNKDTFYPDISAKSIYLHDTRRGVQDQIVEGEHGWVLQGVLARASFRRAAASGQVFTVLSPHISNIYAKKKRIAKNIIQTIRAFMISQN